MKKNYQVILISALALVLFGLLRLLPDTHCALLHADHQPVIDRGLEFCGVNEEANFYSPNELHFPVKVELKFNATGGQLRLLKDDGNPFLDYEIAISHTQKVHLHLRQVSGRMDYIHVHPQPNDLGVWSFTFPETFKNGNPGGDFQAYVDFVPVKTGRTLLAETKGHWDNQSTSSVLLPRNKINSFKFTSDRAGDSATLRVQLSSINAPSLLKLKSIMGSLGHAIVFSKDLKKTGYAHMHPTLEGAEYDSSPTLAFKLKLPPAGEYVIWLNINDGEDDYLSLPFTVK